MNKAPGQLSSECPPGSPMVWLLPGRAHRSYACTVVYYAMINGQVHNTSYRSRY